MTLPLHSFGNTGLKTTKLGLGLAALGRPGYINLRHGEDLNSNYSVQAMEENAHRVLDQAWEKGIRYFDAARSYGKAEEFLGRWLKKRDLCLATVGSKWGYTYTADWKVEAEKHEVKEHSLAVLERQWKESQENLGSHLDIYQIHSASLESGVLDNGNVLDKLWKLKGEGLVIGLSLSGPQQGKTLEKALEVKRDGEHLFGSVQATWNLLESSAGVMLEEAASNGWGIIVKEALANGRLTQRNDGNAFSEQMAVISGMAKKYDTTVDALSIAYVLHQPWAGTVLSGAAREDQLLSNLKSLDVEWDENDLTTLQSLAVDPELYWHSRSQLEWN